MAVLLVMGWGLAPSVAFINTTESDIAVSIAVPQSALDFSDLDARDEFNRPVHSGSKQNELRSLFVSGLNSILLLNLTPSALYEHELMSRTWDVFSGFLNGAARRIHAGMSAMTPDRKMFGVSAFILITFGIFLAAPILLLRQSENQHQRLLSSILSSTIILR